MGQWKETGRCLAIFRLLCAILYSRYPRNLFNAAIHSLHILLFRIHGEIRGVKSIRYCGNQLIYVEIFFYITDASYFLYIFKWAIPLWRHTAVRAVGPDRQTHLCVCCKASLLNFVRLMHKQPPLGWQSTKQTSLYVQHLKLLYIFLAIPTVCKGNVE